MAKGIGRIFHDINNDVVKPIERDAPQIGAALGTMLPGATPISTAMGAAIGAGGKALGGLGGSIAETISGGGGGGGSSSSSNKSSFLDTALGYMNLNGQDPNKIKGYVTAILGVNPNDKTAVQNALSQLGLKPNFGGSGNTADPLSMQMMFNTVIKPYLDQVQAAGQYGQKSYDNAMGNLEAGASPQMKAFDQQNQALTDAAIQQGNASVREQALVDPGVNLMLGLLRQQYTQGLTGLTNPSSTSVPSPLLPTAQQFKATP